MIPINIIAYRSQYGSVNPAGIVGAGIVATTISTAVGVVFAVVMGKKTKSLKILRNVLSVKVVCLQYAQ